jgi:hypothetical protein
MAALAIRTLIANSCTRWRGIFEWHSQDGGRADFSNNLRSSLLNTYKMDLILAGSIWLKVPVTSQLPVSSHSGITPLAPSLISQLKGTQE